MKQIGDRLKDYINDLFDNKPTAYKTEEQPDWIFFDSNFTKINYKIIAVGAFLYKDEHELAELLLTGKLDAIFAFTFGDVTTLHFYANANGEILLDYLQHIASKQSSFIIEVH